MAKEQLQNIDLKAYNDGSFPPLPPLGRNGDNENMKDDKVTFKDLQLVETKLNAKVEASEMKITGKIDVLTEKINNQNKLLWWIMSIISAGIIVPLIAMLIKTLFFNK